MLLYILKSCICLLIFVSFYKLVLERTNMHQFKRFYLLGAVIAAVCIPLITFTVYVEPVVSSFEPVAFPLEETSNISIADSQTIIEEEKTNYTPIILWSIYALGILFFLVRFSIHLLQIIKKIRLNPKHKEKHIINVLLNEVLVPHTFFKYVFVNKTKFENDAIPEEVLLHEQAHARQKHSVDIILTELYQIIFWFNPLVYILKKDMKLNHEFMADAAVLNKGADQSSYQKLLLDYSSNHETCALAHAFNYSSIKKRFTVMKTHTSKRSMWIRSLLLLPILAFMLYGFSSKKEVIKEVEPLMEINAIEDNDYSARSLTINILKNGTYVIDDEMTANKNNLVAVVSQFHQDITPETRNRIMNIHVTSSSVISEKETWFLYESLFDYGFHRMVTPNEEIIKSKGNTPQQTKNYASSYLEGASKNGKKAFVLEIYNNQVRFNNKLIELNDLANTIDSYTKSWEETDYTAAYPSILIKNTSQSFVKQVNNEFTKTHYSKANEGMTLQSAGLDLEISAKAQKSASREQMNTYNKLATHYNEMIRKGGSIKIQMKDVEKLKYIYSLMSKKQRADAEPFPDFPEPPPAPDAPNMADMPPPPPMPENATPAQKKKYKEAIKEYKAWRSDKVKKGDASDIPAPPSPPEPKAPIDHVVDMAKKGAIFYLEGKQISSDKAISVLKKNKSLNIETKQTNSRQPQVYITKKPITINKRKKSTPKTSSVNLETGNININGKEHFYTTKNGITSYFNKDGDQVDKNGNSIANSLTTNPTFYYNGVKISSNKANSLLNKNRKIAVTTKNYDNETYAINLNDLSNNNVNLNRNINPNSVIDLSVAIKKGAKFYLDGKQISTDLALEAVKSNKTITVNTKGIDTNDPRVYISVGKPVIAN